MKPSVFNVSTVYEHTGEMLLFNTLTGAFCAVDPSTASKIDDLFAGRASDSEPDLVELLSKSGFAVADDLDERQIVLERSALGISDENRLDVIVMPNMNCNFACTYCYEEHNKSAMSAEVETRLLTWLNMIIPRFKVVLVSWFGGEPLLSYNTVVRVQQQILKLASLHDVDLSSHMTTNGFLLSPARASKLIALGMRRFQITLDGPATTHNANRPLTNGGDTFDQIHSNICALTRLNREVKVTLRVNYNDQNLPHVPSLLESFPREVRGQLDLALERIFGQDYSNYVDSMPAREIGVTVERTYDLARSLGYSVQLNQLGPDRLTYCYADRKNQVVFNYNGDVFKCTVDKFQPKDRLGVLGEDAKILWESSRLDKWHGVAAFEEKCFSCTFMPMCMGGCRKVRGRHGTVGDDCKLPFAGFDKRLKYRYALERGDPAETFAQDIAPTRKTAEFTIPVKSLKEKRRWERSKS
jgi:uncharacterized protein